MELLRTKDSEYAYGRLVVGLRFQVVAVQSETVAPKWVVLSKNKRCKKLDTPRIFALKFNHQGLNSLEQVLIQFQSNHMKVGEVSFFDTVYWFQKILK